MYRNFENKIVVLKTKRIEITKSIHVCFISQMSLNYKENGGKKAILANPIHQDSVSQCGEYDCSANNKKNGEYYEYPCMSHFTNEL